MKKLNKAGQKDMNKALKYSTSSVVIGTSVSSILVFAVPELKEVETAIQALLTVVANIVMVYELKITE